MGVSITNIKREKMDLLKTLQVSWMTCMAPVNKFSSCPICLLFCGSPCKRSSSLVGENLRGREEEIHNRETMTLILISPAIWLSLVFFFFWELNVRNRQTTGFRPVITMYHSDYASTIPGHHNHPASRYSRRYVFWDYQNTRVGYRQ